LNSTINDVDNFIIDEYDFEREDEMVRELFLQLTEKWAKILDFDPIIIN